MLRRELAVVMALLIGGCESPSHPRSDLDQQMFGPVAIRIHPTFTQIRDWTGDNVPDGVEATLEVRDQFGDPTRSTGRVMFELYRYRPDSPQIRTARVAGPWIFSLNSVGQQQDHWNTALRAYTFQLPDPAISPRQSYVLTAQFDLNPSRIATTSASNATSLPTTRGGRLFDQLIIEAQTPPRTHTPRAPHRTPGH